MVSVDSGHNINSDGKGNPEAPVDEKLSPLDSLYKLFEWKGGFANPKKMRKQLKKFLGGVGSKLDITAKSVQDKMNTTLGMADEWYRKVFPKKEMTYHEVEHVTMTSAVGMKVFLGKLESLRYKYDGQGIFADKEAMDKVIATAAAVFALHEVDDWWGGGESKLRLPNQPDFVKMKENLDLELEAHGISPTDFDKLVTLDDFVNDLPEMLGKIEKEGLDGFLEMVPIEQRMDVAEAIGEALSFADFAQVCNEVYSEEATVTDEDGVEHKTFRGVLALAREFEIFRPNGLKGAGWGKDEDPTKVDLNKAKWGRWFYENKAHPRIMRGLQSLWLFDASEARNLWKKLQSLEQQFVE